MKYDPSNCYQATTILYPTEEQADRIQLGLFSIAWLVHEGVSLKSLTAQKRISRFLFGVDDHALMHAIREKNHRALILDQSLSINNTNVQLGTLGNIMHGALTTAVSKAHRVVRAKVYRRDSYLATLLVERIPDVLIAGEDLSMYTPIVSHKDFAQLSKQFANSTNKRNAFER